MGAAREQEKGDAVIAAYGESVHSSKEENSMGAWQAYCVSCPFQSANHFERKDRVDLLVALAV
jgi:hypothetical protein